MGLLAVNTTDYYRVIIRWSKFCLYYKSKSYFKHLYECARIYLEHVYFTTISSFYEKRYTMDEDACIYMYKKICILFKVAIDFFPTYFIYI